MKSKKIIVSIVVCLVIAIIAVFVVPSSSSYLSEGTISGEKKKGYSFYKSISISNKLKDVDFNKYRDLKNITYLNLRDNFIKNRNNQ